MKFKESFRMFSIQWLSKKSFKTFHFLSSLAQDHFDLCHLIPNENLMLLRLIFSTKFSNHWQWLYQTESFSIVTSQVNHLHHDSR